MELETAASSSSRRAVKHPFDLLIVLDFEATCEDGNRRFPNEVIEFPAVVLDTESLTIRREFREYVKPVINPRLSEFCTDLTGIQQDTVDSADVFPVVYERFQAWYAQVLADHPDKTCAFVTCGDWDLKTMLKKQCAYDSLSIPDYLTTWINIKVPFQAYSHGRRCGMDGMLSYLGLPLVGRHHSGLDDSRNIASIAAHLMKKGMVLHSTT